VVRLDRAFAEEQLAHAPSEFSVHSRNPARSFVFGGQNMVFANVSGPPFVREGATRRDATFADLERFNKLAQVFDPIDSAGGQSCEPNDLPLDSRHLYQQLSVLTLTDKPHMGSTTTGWKAADSLRMAEIVYGAEAMAEAPRLYTVINVNSPLRYASDMLEVLVEFAQQDQVTVITPFLLMGAMSPVSIPATLVQQTAELIAGVALAQLIRPGAPIVIGSFLSHTDMQSGAPGFGGPESAIGLLASGQIARHLRLPWRAGGGGLTSSTVVDAQAAYEALNTLLPAFLAGANFVLQTAGWLESGLVACYEKYIVDIELVRMLREEFTPLEVDLESLAFDAHVEVGHAGHFLGASHTLTRFRDCFYRPLLSSTANFQRWDRLGAQDAAARAAHIWRDALERWQSPPLDDGIRHELGDYVARRRRELGD
jgi:trimethylamine--corrinoid protein Co-methyltransferase